MVSADEEKTYAIIVALIKKGRLDDLKNLVQQNGHNLSTMQSFTGMTPLMHASIHGTVDTVKWIVENFGGLDSKDSLGRTPYHLAASAKRSDVIEALSELDESEEAIDI